MLPRYGAVVALSLAFLPSTSTAETQLNGGALMPTIQMLKQSKPLPKRARIAAHGKASVPLGAPKSVQEIVKAGNKIANTPYVWGGGHGSFFSSGYDCSGSVSYVLHKAKLLKTPMVSGALASWGEPGKGKWVTIYANGGHVYMEVAGLRFDTSGADPSRWQATKDDHSGYEIRHPSGL